MNQSISYFGRQMPVTLTDMSPIGARRRNRTLEKVVWYCLWIVLTPQLIPLFGGVLSDLRILPIVGAVGTLGALTLPRTIPGKWFYWPLLFLAAVIFTTVLNIASGNSWPSGFNDLYLIASGVSIYYMTVATVTTRRRFIQLSVLVIGGALITASSFMLENSELSPAATSILKSFAGQGRVNAGLLDNRNWLAAPIICGLVGAFTLLELQRRLWRRALLILSSLGLLVASFFTGSRGTVISAVFLVGLWFIGVNSKHRASRVFVLVFMFTAVWSVQNLGVVSYTFERLKLSNYEEVVHERRFDLVVEAINIWSENVPVGVGLGAVLAKTGNAAHMAFTGLLAETGVLGFTLFYLPALWLLVETFRMSRSRAGVPSEQQKILRIGAIGLLTFVVYSTFNETYLIKNYYVSIGLLSAAAFCSWQTPSRKFIGYEQRQEYIARPYSLLRNDVY